MKYIRQMLVILGFSVAGELLHHWISLPIPASIYGMVLLFGGLALKIVPGDWVKDTGGFLVTLLPLLFIAPVVGLLSCWDEVASDVVAIGIIIAVSTVVTFAVAGFVTERLVRRGGKKDA